MERRDEAMEISDNSDKNAIRPRNKKRKAGGEEPSREDIPIPKKKPLKDPDTREDLKTRVENLEMTTEIFNNDIYELKLDNAALAAAGDTIGEIARQGSKIVDSSNENCDTLRIGRVGAAR